jgi:hypothetical protein
MPKRILHSDPHRRFSSLLTPREAQRIARLTTPYKIQQYLDSIDYSEEIRYRCPLNVVKDQKGHCFDGAVFAAAMLRRIGYEPLLVDILPNENDDDHVLAVFRQRGHWGAVAKSNFSGLRYREPVFRSVRELVLSYFEDFFNSLGEKTMRGYTRPLNLAPFDRTGWLVRDEALDAIGDRLDEIRKFKVLTPAMIRGLSYADERSVKAGLLGARADGLFKPKKG